MGTSIGGSSCISYYFTLFLKIDGAEVLAARGTWSAKRAGVHLRSLLLAGQLFQTILPARGPLPPVHPSRDVATFLKERKIIVDFFQEVTVHLLS